MRSPGIVLRMTVSSREARCVCTTRCIALQAGFAPTWSTSSTPAKLTERIPEACGVLSVVIVWSILKSLAINSGSHVRCAVNGGIIAGSKMGDWCTFRCTGRQLQLGRMSTTIPSHGRELPGKYVRIAPGEHLVYHFWPKSVVQCAPNGEALNEFNEVGYVFDDLVDAQRYCYWKVNQNPKLGCVIYDSRWKIVDQVINAEYLKRLSRQSSPKRQFLWSVLFLISGGALIWLDSRHNWVLLIGVLIGARLAVAGIVKLVLALLRLRESRVRSEDRNRT